MSNRKRVLPSLKELKEDMKQMTFREKLEHLWTYYGMPVLLILGITLFIGLATISSAINKNKELVVSGIVVNVQMTVQGHDYLSVDYEEYLGLNKKQQVMLSTSDFSSLMDPTSSEDNFTAATKLTNLAGAHMLDYAIMDSFALQHYLGWDRAMFMDLRDCFTEEQMAAFAEQDMLWYVLYTDDDVEFESDDISPDDPRLVPVALKLDKTRFGQEALVHPEKPSFFVVVGMNKGPEAALAVWDYIQNWNG